MAHVSHIWQHVAHVHLAAEESWAAWASCHPSFQFHRQASGWIVQDRGACILPRLQLHDSGGCVFLCSNHRSGYGAAAFIVQEVMFRFHLCCEAIFTSIGQAVVCTEETCASDAKPATVCRYENEGFCKSSFAGQDLNIRSAFRPREDETSGMSTGSALEHV